MSGRPGAHPTHPTPCARTHTAPPTHSGTNAALDVATLTTPSLRLCKHRPDTTEPTRGAAQATKHPCVHCHTRGAHTASHGGGSTPSNRPGRARGCRSTQADAGGGAEQTRCRGGQQAAAVCCARTSTQGEHWVSRRVLPPGCTRAPACTTKAWCEAGLWWSGSCVWECHVCRRACPPGRARAVAAPPAAAVSPGTHAALRLTTTTHGCGWAPLQTRRNAAARDHASARGRPAPGDQRQHTPHSAHVPCSACWAGRRSRRGACVGEAGTGMWRHRVASGSCVVRPSDPSLGRRLLALTRRPARSTLPSARSTLAVPASITPCMHVHVLKPKNAHE